MFHCTYCSTLKCVTSLRGPFLRHCARRQQNCFQRNAAAMASRWQHCVPFDRPRFESQTFLSTDERVIARPTERKIVSLWGYF